MQGIVGRESVGAAVATNFGELPCCNFLASASEWNVITNFIHVSDLGIVDSPTLILSAPLQKRSRLPARKKHRSFQSFHRPCIRGQYLPIYNMLASRQGRKFSSLGLVTAVGLSHPGWLWMQILGLWMRGLHHTGAPAPASLATQRKGVARSLRSRIWGRP